MFLNNQKEKKSSSSQLLPTTKFETAEIIIYKDNKNNE